MTNLEVLNDRLGIIKQTPRQASVDDVEWLCEEVERLRAEVEELRHDNERFYQANVGLVNELADGGSHEPCPSPPCGCWDAPPGTHLPTCPTVREKSR